MSGQRPPVKGDSSYKVAARALHRALAPLFSSHPIEATLLAASVAATSVADARIWVEFSKVNGASQTALNKRNVGDFWHNRRLMFLVLVKLALASTLQDFCAGWLCLRWRGVVTKALLHKYLPAPNDSGVQHFPFYRMKLDLGAPPNPDQRIADDVSDAVGESVDLARALISNTVSFATWSRVLLRISPRAFYGLFLYALVGTCVTVWGFSKGLVRSQHQVRNREAHFRFALVRVDECAESVAFYRAADSERSRLMSAFNMLVRDSQCQLFWKMGQGAFQRTYSWVTMILPSMILAPAYFRGEVELGAISQIFSAFNSVKQVLMFVANNFGVLATLQAKAQRLEDLHATLVRAAASPQTTSDPCDCHCSCKNDEGSCAIPGSSCGMVTKGTPRIELDEVPMDGEVVLLRVRSVRVALQTGSATLRRMRWLGTVDGKAGGSTFDVAPGMAVLLRGASGVGKSALLRAVAGLWTDGVGYIRRTSTVFFLPQVPYLPTGNEAATSTLREQLLFPTTGEGNGSRQPHSAEDLRKVVADVGLGSLLAEPAGLDTEADWALCLSGGERQRLAFARLLLQLAQQAGTQGEGCLVLLDEATSACDEDTEGLLYDRLLSRLQRGALVSVGHRSSLLRFHTASLEMSSL